MSSVEPLIDYSKLTNKFTDYTRKCRGCNSTKFTILDSQEGDGIKLPSYEVYECNKCKLQTKYIIQKYAG